jgi:hypothetical protein
METRNRWVILIVLVFVVVGMTVLIPVVIASDFYQNATVDGDWTPIANDNPTVTRTLGPTPVGAGDLSNSEPSPTPVVKENCTNTSIYWVYHPELWPSQFLIGEISYTKEQAIQYMESPNYDTPVLLFIQLHTSFLNLLSGADPESIEQTMVEASIWLSEHPIGEQVSDLTRQEGQGYIRVLEDYNNGITGPGQCEEDPIIALPTETPNLTSTNFALTAMAATPTPSATPTFTATNTRAPTIVLPPTSTPTSKPSKPDKPDKPDQPKPTKEPRPTDPPDE